MVADVERVPLTERPAGRQRWWSGRSWGWWTEHAFGFAILAALSRAFYELFHVGILPSPFFFDASDTWMDWFNPAWWAHNPGTYDIWGSIYPPISFLFLRIFGLGRCYEMEVVMTRSCDWVGVLTLHGFYLLDMYLVAKSYLKIDRATAMPRTIAVCAGVPMLIALDRGNMIVVGFTCFVLGYGPLLRSARLRWLFVGMAINFKVYLLPSLLSQLLRRRWRWFEGALLATVGVYFLTWALYGDGWIGDIVYNLVGFASPEFGGDLLATWTASSYNPLVGVLNASDGSMVVLVGSDIVETWSRLLPLLVRFGQGMIALAALAAFLRPEVVPMYRLSNFALIFALITFEAGGYTSIIILFLVFMEPWRGIGRIGAMVSSYLLCIPIDIIMHRLPPTGRFSFWEGYELFIDFPVTYSPLFRPAVLILIGILLACTTLREVWVDIRRQGWKGRRRFAADMPILLNGGAAPEGQVRN